MRHLQEGVGRRVRGPLGASEEGRRGWRRRQRGTERGGSLAPDPHGNAEQVLVFNWLINHNYIIYLLIN